MKVYLTGVGRSGTTYFRQILSYLSSKDEINFPYHKHHGLLSEINSDDIIFTPCRDLRDVIVSRWRIILSEEEKYNEVEERIMTKEEIDEELKPTSVLNSQLKDIVCNINNYGEQVKLINYHQFINNPEYILDCISFCIGKNVNSSLYLKELEKFSFKKNKERANKLNSFLDWDGHGIHGHHCYKGEVGGWKKYIPKEYHDYVYTTLKSLLLQNPKLKNKWKKFIQE